MIYQNIPVVSKLSLNGDTYYIKDAEARVAIENIEGLIAGGVRFIGITQTSALVDGYTGSIVIDGITYIPSGIPASDEKLLATGDIAIKAANSGSVEESFEFIWSGSKWEELGSTGHLGSLAYVDQTTASYTPSGNVSVTLSNANVVASATQGTLPSKQADSFTANTPTVIDTTKFNGGSKASDQFTPATYSHTGFSGGSLGTATTSTFAKSGVTASYSSANEEITFTTATTASAVTAQGTFTPATYGTDTFTGGSFTEGTFTPASIGNGFYTAGTAASFSEGEFNAGTLPTFTTATVGVNSALFTGSAATIVANPKTA